MPKFELKEIQRELEKGQIWPVYWLHGPENYKACEILRWLRNALFGGTVLSPWDEEKIEMSEADASLILDAAKSISLGGRPKLILIKDAHLLKQEEGLSELCGPPGPLSDRNICVFLAKDFDQRKKISKMLVEKAAVVACDRVPENQREGWIQYLAKKRQVQLEPESLSRLILREPWSLDQVDQAIEMSLLGNEIQSEQTFKADYFIESFFQRDLKRVLPQILGMAQNPQEALPLVGLIAWNIRHLAMIKAGPAGRTPSLKISPFLVERIQRWSSKWNLQEILDLQSMLFDLDFKLKQTSVDPLGLWTAFATRFCNA